MNCGYGDRVRRFPVSTWDLWWDDYHFWRLLGDRRSMVAASTATCSRAAYSGNCTNVDRLTGSPLLQASATSWSRRSSAKLASAVHRLVYLDRRLSKTIGPDSSDTERRKESV